MTPPTPLRWAETWRLIRSDFHRLADWLGGGGLAQKAYWSLQPNFQAIFWYRIARYLYVNGWRNTARLIFLVKLYMTRVEIPPTADIGEGLLIAHATGVVLFGKLGRNVSVMGGGGTGGGVQPLDIGGGPGYPVVGDNVFFGWGAKVFGPIRVGDGVHLSPDANVFVDVPAGSKVYGPRAVIKPPPDVAPAPSAASQQEDVA